MEINYFLFTKHFSEPSHQTLPNKAFLADDLCFRPTSTKPLVSCRRLALFFRPASREFAPDHCKHYRCIKYIKSGWGLAQMHPQPVKYFLVVKRKTVA
jgi:hypothetical protein